MHRHPAVADQVFRYDIMDKTLADYIKRIQDSQNREKKVIAKEQTVSPLPETEYLVYPESQSIDSDEKINPFSKV
jgi:hypothetical protein